MRRSRRTARPRTGKPFTAVEEPKDVRIDLPVDAHLPPDYIASDRLRLEGYRRLAAAADDAAVDAVVEELVDRYGPLPETAQRLVAVARLRLLCREYGITEVSAVSEATLRLSPLHREQRPSQVEKKKKKKNCFPEQVCACLHGHEHRSAHRLEPRKRCARVGATGGDSPAGMWPHLRYRYEHLRRDLQLVGGKRRLFGPAVVNIMPFDYGVRFAGQRALVHNLSAGPGTSPLAFTPAVTGSDRASIRGAICCYGRDEVSDLKQRLLPFFAQYVTTGVAPKSENASWLRGEALTICECV